MTHGNSAGAVEDFTAGLAVEPQNAPLMYLRGSAYAAQERWADGLTDYTAALTAKPDYALAYQARAEVLDRLGRQAVAKSDRQRASHRH
jgi:tetratricopeptide (TPR) repeat protein